MVGREGESEREREALALLIPIKAGILLAG